MTSVSSGSEKINIPMILKPSGKDYLWGGRRLKDDFGKEEIDMSPLAETWEFSTHPEGESISASGPFKGMKLSEIVRMHPAMLGTNYLDAGNTPGDIPVLVKFIDASKDLSVQVHPTDEYALLNENGQRGKSEMWYVVDAQKDAKLVYGFKREVSKELIMKAIEEGTLEKLLQFVPVHKGDVFFINAGIIHGICKGALVAEVQECSNLTYRIYDYDRVDKTGKKRDLHIEKALDVICTDSSAAPRQPMRVFKYKPGYASEFLFRCRYFQTERVLINTERIRKMADFATGADSFEVLLCIDGCGTIFYDDGDTGKSLDFFKGDCIFVPASSVSMKLHGQAEFLKISC